MSVSHLCADHSCSMSLPAYTQQPLCHAPRTNWTWRAWYPCRSASSMTTWCTLAPSQVWRVVDPYSPWPHSAVMTTWISATVTCTWSVGSLIQMSRTSRPWKQMLPRVGMLPWAKWTRCYTPSSDNTTGLGDEHCPGGHEWRHLPVHGYGCDAKKTWLRHLEGWLMDEDGKYDAQENIGLISRPGMIASCTWTCCWVTGAKQCECPVGAVM